MGTPARVVIAAPLPRLPLTAVAPARTRAPYTALVLAAIILDARSVESTSPASIRRSVERSIARSIDRSRHRAIEPSFHRSRLDARGGHGDDDRRGGRDHRSRLVAVSARRHASDFYTHRDGTPICYVRDASIFTPTSSPSLGTFDRDRADPIARVSGRLGRFFAGTSRPHTVARARTTGDDDGRRETGDGRRETGDATRARRRRPSRRLDEGGRGTRREDGFGALFHACVGAREGLVRRSSLLVGDDSHGFEESSRRISTSPTRGGA